MNLDLKGNELIPAIVQDVDTREILMLGYMNADALKITVQSGKVTFFSRSKKRLWTKGEQSGNYLKFIEVKNDCDEDTLLIQARPTGPTCHTGSVTCWGNPQRTNYGVLDRLEKTITNRVEFPSNESYISRLLAKGLNKVAQKVGEEAVELVIEAKDDDQTLFVNEAADLLFHYLILLKAKKYSLKDILNVLEEREKNR